MASIVLSSIGAASGSMFGGVLGASMGRLFGAMAGRFVDNKLFGYSSTTHSSGPRLKDLSIQTSSYGVMIPMVFGVIRTAGNIIWSMPLKEVMAAHRYEAGAKGSKVSHVRNEYKYFASFAVSICEGPIDEVIRIYAGRELLRMDQYNIRIYKGTEDQMPDTLIESVKGLGKAPAFRGQAYVVFEDFPLAEFGNHLPNFNFEVRKKVAGQYQQTAEELVQSLIVIPGGGEFVYDTKPQYKSFGDAPKNAWCQRGRAKSINTHTHYGKTNAIVSMDQMQKTLPNLKWVAVVVNWFGNSLDVKDCTIRPGVEYNDGRTRTIPDSWSVAGYNRQSAHQISKVDGRPTYGGSINDASILRYIEELKSRGYKVMFYPMLFMDLPEKPWRGMITGDAKEVSSFFNRSHGYNDFVMHYARLLEGKVDAFVIGSEFRELTSIKSENDSFPAVSELIMLASQCKSQLGKDTIITYAADWSEYHHTEGGWYHLDPLWASDGIDVVGIDSYFPLSNSEHSLYDVDDIIKGWDEGEGVDYYYAGENKTDPKPLAAPYAWKNIRWWWENYHINPNGEKTAWDPKSKKIWFTEYGFPSVDCTTNEPNVFYDPKSPKPTFPIHSKGTTDFKAQRSAIIATELKWHNSDMIENKFLWCWDARPYPYWPDFHRVWSDSGAWQKGHWVQGKIGHSTLAGVLETLCHKSSLEAAHYVCENLDDNLDGFLVDSRSSVRGLIELLQKAYQFDALESDGRIIFKNTKDHTILHIPHEDFICAPKQPILSIRRAQEVELPQKVDVNYVDISKNYQISNQHSMRNSTLSRQKESLDLPLVLSQGNARLIAESYLHSMWTGRTSYSFSLSTKYINLAPGDVISTDYEGRTHEIKIVSIQFGKNNVLKIEGVSYKKFHKTQNDVEVLKKATEFSVMSDTTVEILDLPHIRDYDLEKGYVWLAGKNMTEGETKGATVFASLTKGSGYKMIADVSKLSTYGKIVSFQEEETDKIIVNLENGELISIGDDAFDNGGNLCLIGNEIIQFKNARLIDDHQYELKHLRRGISSTESHMNGHESGDRFIMLDDNLVFLELPSQYVGKTVYIKSVSKGKTLGQTTEEEFVYQANSRRPFAPTDLSVSECADGYHVSWNRRNRLFTEYGDYISLPQEEVEERYVVETFDENRESLGVMYVTSVTSCEISKSAFSVSVAQISRIGAKGFEAFYDIAKD